VVSEIFLLLYLNYDFKEAPISHNRTFVGENLIKQAISEIKESPWLQLGECQDRRSLTYMFLQVSPLKALICACL
jgi:hypothetical protein